MVFCGVFFEGRGERVSEWLVRGVGTGCEERGKANRDTKGERKLRRVLVDVEQLERVTP